jgi:biotin operon repressor
VPLAFRDERLFISKFMIGMARELHRSLFPTRAGRQAGHLDCILVACCVSVGHAEGRPMSSTKVAHLLGLPRTTVSRRLAELVAVGAVERHGFKYYVSAERQRRVDARQFARIGRILRDLADAIDHSPQV